MKYMNIILKLPLILYSIAIFVISSMPQPPISVNYFWSMDKLFHLFAYFVYFIFSLIFFISYFPTLKLKRIQILSLLISVFFCISDEIHQYCVPGRSAEIGDIIANFTGIALSYFVTKIILNKIKYFEIHK